MPDDEEIKRHWTPDELRNLGEIVREREPTAGAALIWAAAEFQKWQDDAEERTEFVLAVINKQLRTRIELLENEING